MTENTNETFFGKVNIWFNQIPTALGLRSDSDIAIADTINDPTMKKIYEKMVDIALYDSYRTSFTPFPYQNFAFAQSQQPLLVNTIRYTNPLVHYIDFTFGEWNNSFVNDADSPEISYQSDSIFLSNAIKMVFLVEKDTIIVYDDKNSSAIAKVSTILNAESLKIMVGTDEKTISVRDIHGIVCSMIDLKAIYKNSAIPENLAKDLNNSKHTL